MTIHVEYKKGGKNEKQKNNKFDPFKNLVLDEEEKAIEEALERGEYESNPNFEETKKMLQQAPIQYRNREMVNDK